MEVFLPKRTRGPSAGRIVAIVLLANVTLGCRSFPDLEPFAAATAEVGAGVRTAGAAVDAEIRTLAAPLLLGNDADTDAERSADYEKVRQQLETQWALRVGAVDALAAYSDSLAEVFDAGKSGKEAAQRVADAASELSGKLFPAAGFISDAAGTTVTKIYEQIAAARAKKKLAESVASTHDAIEEIGAELDRSLAQLETLLAPKALEETLRARTIERFALEHRLDLGQRAQLLQKRETAQFEFVDLLDQPVSEPADAVVEYMAQVEAKERQLRRLDSLIATSDDAYAGYAAEIDIIQERFAAERQAVQLAREAVARWVRLHGELADALTERRSLNVASLVQVAQQLRATIEGLK